MNGQRPQIGSLVWVSGALSKLGIGKVVGCAPERVSVEYFYSVARRRLEEVPASQANVMSILATQNLCYVCLPQSRWQTGRIGRFFEGECALVFRQGQVRFLASHAIHVRCVAPIAYPTETLILNAHETPSFHDRRFRFVYALLRQRAACHGLTSDQLRRTRTGGRELAIIDKAHHAARTAFSAKYEGELVAGEHP